MRQCFARLRRRRAVAGRAVAAAGLLIVPFVAACGSSAHSQTPAPRPVVRMATGLPGASFRPLSTAIVDRLEKQLPQIDFVSVDTPGSNGNLEYIQAGNADIALAYSDGAYRSYVEGLRAGERSNAARAIAVLHPASVHVLVRATSSIRSIADLRQLRIAAGPPGTGTAFISEMLLKFFGVPPGKAELVALSFEDSVGALMRGDVDSAFIVSSDPVATIRAATDGGARLVEITGDAVDQLLAEYPFFRRNVISVGTYPNQTRAVPTVAVDTLLVCRRQLDDALVRMLTAAFFRALPYVAADFPALLSMDLDRAPAAPLPLHPGAALFYRESELAR